MAAICTVCNSTIDGNVYGRIAKDDKVDYFCSEECLLEFVLPDEMYPVEKTIGRPRKEED